MVYVHDVVENMKSEESIPRIKIPPRGLGQPRATPEPLSEEATILARTVQSTPSSETAPVERGSLLVHYAIMEKIGEGGMGIVYLARDRRLGRYVAIKRLSPRAQGQRGNRDRFLREAESIAALNHIHIVHIYELGEDEDGPYIVMEYVAGPPDASPSKNPPAPYSVADRVHSQGPYNLNDALDLVLKVGRAVEYAHLNNVIHRDLKPSNVLLDASGEPKVVDFGLARKSGLEDASLTLTGEKMLSLGFGAPEQEVDASTTDERADVYGLGAFLYFIISGQNPRYFREADVPEVLRTPIVKALETDRNKRWATAKEFMNSLLMIRAPSTIEVPTARKTWRCKWCDSVNPMVIQFCGKCGWDGREQCPECGAETRTGVQFCSGCGADLRHYETARFALERIRACRDRKAYEMIPQFVARIANFRPAGPNGEKILAEAYFIRDEVHRSLERRDHLKEDIRRRIDTGNYEAAQQLIAEYNTLSDDAVFAAEAKELPKLIARRELERARKGVAEGAWDSAEQTCLWLRRSAVLAENEIEEVLALIRRHRRQLRVRWVGGAVVGLFVLYLLAAAPLYRLVNPSRDSLFDSVFRLHSFIHDGSFLQGTLDRYAGLWGADGLYPHFNRLMLPATRPTGERVRVEKLSDLQARYQVQLDRANSEYATRTQQWPIDYARELTAMLERFQKSGDYDSWTLVKVEADRFEQEKVLTPEPPSTGPQDLVHVQKKYRETLDRNLADKNSGIRSATENYVRDLETLQRDLTKASKMDAAAQVNQEIKRMKSIISSLAPSSPDKVKKPR